jgi:hypothetical protein
LNMSLSCLMVMKDMVFQLEGVDATDLEEGVVSPGGVG